MLKKIVLALTLVGTFGGVFLSAADQDLAVTVYNNDLALIRDVRKMAVKEGKNELRFTDVAAQIDPTSVHFKSLTSPDKVAILEQNYEYDLVSADKILEKYLDQEVQLFTKEGKMFSGKLLAASGDVVLEKRDGGIQSLSKSAIQNVDFPKLPAGLITRPTLVWLLQSALGGNQDMEVSYLSGGMNWHAEYVAVLDKDEKKLELSAWVSIDNRSGATFPDAKVKLIAGEVNRVTPPQPKFARMAMMAEAGGANADQFQEKSFFEYHLYTLSRPATLKDNQIKQLSLFPSASVNMKKIYKYDGVQDPRKVRVNVEFTNSKAENLGMALPAGKIRVYKQDSDKSQEFVGEDRMEHTPKDEKVRLSVGDAFDVVAERHPTESRSLGTRAKQDSIQIKLRNHKDADIEVTVVEHFYSDWEITKASHKYEKKDANIAEFKIPVAKNGETILEYTSITKW